MAKFVPFINNKQLVVDPLTNIFSEDFSHPLRDVMQHSFKLDVREEILHYTVEAEMPGVKKEEIEIIFEKEMLTVSVTHRDLSNEEKSTYIHKERRYTNAQRSVYLPNADSNGITAKLTDGVLYITVPKLEDKKEKTKIAVQ